MARARAGRQSVPVLRRCSIQSRWARFSRARVWRPRLAVPAASPARNLKRFKVRDDYGRLVAARWYGEDRGKTALILPDGQLGIADTLVPTKDPFTPLTGEELRGLLQDGPYAGFQVVTSPHYLIFYKSTLTFAEGQRAAARKYLSGANRRFPPVYDIHPLTRPNFRSSR